MGWTAGKVLQTGFSGITRAEAIRQIQQTGELISEVTQAPRDGSQIEVEAHTVSMRDEAGRITGYITVNRDITERKRAESAALESEARYHRVLDDMMEGCQIIDFEWRYVYINEVAAEQGKRTREELLHHTMMEMYPGIEKTELFTFLRQCMLERTDVTFGPVLDARFAIREFGGTLGPGILPQGPWLPKNTIHPSGVLASVPNATIPNLPLRPIITGRAEPGAARGLYVPSRNLRDEMDRFGGFDQNFSQSELEWDHGAGQDEHELREAYLDLELLEGRLWFRVGKQSIVWGKTELFRTTDQFNPQTLALSSLPSLEESRIALWSQTFNFAKKWRAESGIGNDDWRYTGW